MTRRLALAAAVALLPSLACASEADSIERAFVGTWTTPCVGPNQCTLHVFDHPTTGQRFAAFRVGSHDPADETKCGFVFPLAMNTDGQLYTLTKDFTLTLTYRGDHLNVAGLPAALCGLPLSGDYRELGD